jgi:hypothetical protein
MRTIMICQYGDRFYVNEEAFSEGICRNRAERYEMRKERQQTNSVCLYGDRMYFILRIVAYVVTGCFESKRQARQEEDP